MLGSGYEPFHAANEAEMESYPALDSYQCQTASDIADGARIWCSPGSNFPVAIRRGWVERMAALADRSCHCALPERLHGVRAGEQFGLLLKPDAPACRKQAFEKMPNWMGLGRRMSPTPGTGKASICFIAGILREIPEPGAAASTHDHPVLFRPADTVYRQVRFPASPHRRPERECRTR